MTRRRALFAAAAATLAVFLLLFGGGLAGTGAEHALRIDVGTAAAKQDSLEQLIAGFSTGDTASYVRALERRVARGQGDGDTLTLLGLAYQQRARETGDPAFYRLSARALARASAAHGAVLAPGIASYTRVANARELIGKPAAAIEADRLALAADSTVPEHVAWTMVQLGNVEFNTGHLARAAGAYQRALRRLPGYVHAEAGLARVDAAQGRYTPAIRRLRHVVDRLPIPAYAILLGDVLHASGREAEARHEYALVGAIERLFAANGVRTELQTAVFDLDHNRDVPDALARARRAYALAPGIYAEDALAWGLFRAGRCAQARAHSAHALRLGTRDALFVFHRAMIERCLGSPTATGWFGHALAINPHFSILWLPVARKALL